MTNELNYIFFEEEDGEARVGFNRYNGVGFIDDGSDWSEQDFDSFYDTVVDPLGLEETGTFTYAFSDTEEELENALIALGMKAQAPGWD